MLKYEENMLVKKAVSGVIDLNNLEKIVSEHVFILDMATEKIPALKKQMMDKKDLKEFTRSKVYFEIKGDFDSKKGKTTEANLTALVNLDPVYIQSLQDFNGATFEYEKAVQKKEVMLQKESALRLLSDLYRANYWSLHSVTER